MYDILMDGFLSLTLSISHDLKKTIFLQIELSSNGLDENIREWKKRETEIVQN